MRLEIRKMEADDWPAVAQIYRQGMETGIATFASEVPSFEEWSASHLEDCRLVAESSGEVVAWAAMSAVSRRAVYRGVAEISIYVSGRHRGRKVGETLLCALIEESERAGYWSLRAAIFEENAASVALHHKCGFRTVGFFERVGCDREGRWRNNLLLERRSRKIGLD